MRVSRIAAARFGTTSTLLAQAWHERTPPRERAGHALAYDLVRARTVLFGGINTFSSFTSNLRADTWVLDGAGWRHVPTFAQPPARHRHALAHDSLRGRTGLFGGWTDGGPAADT
jgi:hypothetical protein